MLKHLHTNTPILFFFVCKRSCMLCVCLLHQHELSFYLKSTKPDTSVIFSPNESLRRVNVWSRHGSLGVMHVSQEHKDALHSSGTATRFGTLALIYTELHRCFGWDICVKCFFQEHNRAICPMGASNLQPYDYYSAT